MDETDKLWSALLAYQDLNFAAHAQGLSHLVHYTSFAALKGIIEAEELWFSSSFTTNDLGEIQRGKEMLERLTAKGLPLANIIDELKVMSPALWQSLNNNYRRRKFGDLYHTYISCWSRCELASNSHDDLTMWRGYAADGNGVAIVIDVSELAASAVASEIIICPVFYENETGFAQRASIAMGMFRDGLKANKDVASANLELVANAFSELCFYLAVTHKHPGFAAEKEWRFAWSKHRDPSEQGLQRYLRPVLAGNDLIEKFCLPIKNDPTLTPAELDIRALVQSVMLGPCDDIVLKRDAIVSLLRSKGFSSPEARVSCSEIPYRPARRG